MKAGELISFKYIVLILLVVGYSKSLNYENFLIPNEI